MELEFKNFYFIYLGLVVFILWAIDFFKLIKTLRLPWKNYHTGNQTAVLSRLMAFFLGATGILFLTYSLMGPRYPQSSNPSSMNVLDIFLVVDVSRSMLADDIVPNRLEVAKTRLKEFAALKPKDRIGIILFSEKPYTLLPLTIDPDMINKVLTDIDVGYLGSGTNIGDGLALGVARLQITETKSKIIVLLTDGVSNVGNLTPLQAAEEAKKLGVKIYTIGLGTESDARIPVGQSVFGQQQYQRIPGGSVDFETLNKIATMTGARAYTAQSDNSLKQVFLEIDQLERSETKGKTKVVYEELYYKYLMCGLILYLLSEIMRRFWIKEVF